MNILKEEINQAAADVMSLFKWKMTIVAGTAAVGLGWTDFRPDSDTGQILLYSVGFLCAFIDWFVFRRYTIIHTIARYLRKYEGNDPSMLELKKYEVAMLQYRDSSLFFISERWAHFIASMTFAIGLPILNLLRPENLVDATIWIAVLAVASIAGLFTYHDRQRRNLLED